MNPLKRMTVPLLALAAALALAACAKTVDSDDLEGQLEEQFAASGSSDVTADCPDDEKVEKGNEFTCTLTEDKSGQSIDVIVTMTDDDGHFEAKADPSSG